MGKKDYDPAMHTAEHILNQTMDRLFACGRSFNAHIEKKKSKCDYRFPRPLTAEEISAVEEAVNRGGGPLFHRQAARRCRRNDPRCFGRRLRPLPLHRPACAPHQCYFQVSDSFHQPRERRAAHPVHAAV
jgi:hypothetical protein